MRANYNEIEIKSLLQKLRIFNQNIGEYQLFAITENFDYAVKLSNGKILINLEDLQDDRNGSLIPARLELISKRFTSDARQEIKQELKSDYFAPTHELQPKKSNSKRYIVIAFLIIGALVLYGVNRNDDDGFESRETYEEKVMTVEEMEQSQPAKFLNASGDYNQNFWRTKLKVHGTITNSATVARYKDAVVRVTYYSKTKTVLGSKDYTIYELFEPHSTANFELKIENFNNVNSIGWEVVNASIVY
jgi:hypothetical protein